MQRTERGRQPQLESEIWNKIANLLDQKERARGFHLVCHEFHDMSWAHIRLLMTCSDGNDLKAVISPPSTWVMTVWPRIANLQVMFLLRDLVDDKPEDVSSMFRSLRATGGRRGKQTSLKSITLYRWIKSDCTLPKQLLDCLLSTLPNLSTLRVSGFELSALPLQRLQELDVSMTEYSEVFLDGVRRMGPLRKLAMRGNSRDDSPVAVGNISLEGLKHLEELYLDDLIPSSICLQPSCRVSLRLPSTAVTWELERCLRTVNLTHLLVRERSSKLLQEVLSSSLGRPGSLQAISLGFLSSNAGPSESTESGHPSERVIRLTGPLVRHCKSLEISFQGKMSVQIPASMQLHKLSVDASNSHSKAIDAEDLQALGGSLRKLDITLITDFCYKLADGFEEGVRPAWCEQLLAAANKAEKHIQELELNRNWL